MKVLCRDAAGQPGHGSGRVRQIFHGPGRVGSAKFWNFHGSGRVTGQTKIFNGSDGSRKNVWRVRRVKKKYFTGQTGQRIFRKIAIFYYFLSEFSKIHPKICILLHEIDVFVEKSVNIIKKVRKKIITGQTGQGKKWHGSDGSQEKSHGSGGSRVLWVRPGRVGSGQKGLKKTTGRVGSGQKSLFSTGHGSTGRPGSAVDPQQP